MAEKHVQQPQAVATQAKFTDLPTADIERSTFDMSHSWKGTADEGIIVPTLLQEILPGDTFQVNSTIFMRLATPLKPIMDTVTADIHFFFVPNRLVWDNWQFFMGERANPDDDPTTITMPIHEADVQLPAAANTLYDYFGLPLVESGSQVEINVNALPFRGYDLIYNEWYRNQNLYPEFNIPKGDGPDDPSDPTGALYAPKRRHKKGDYFTKALPWPQKGDPVFLPLGDTAPVVPIAGDPLPYFSITGVDQNLTTRTGDGTEIHASQDGQPASLVRWGSDTALQADLTTATAATINDIRTAFQIQKLLERDARGGTRYIEIILSHFNVQSPDMRLQRPEYLGGGTSRIMINPVAATAGYDPEGAGATVPQGNLAAVGTGLVKGGFNHSFTEHGFLFGLLSTRQDLTYQQGLDRMWSRQTRYDHYWPALSHLGEQTILNKELYYDNEGESDNEGIWGYQERYAEYRYQPSRITGLFRSEHPESLDVWHLAQDYAELPLLDINFVSEDAPIDRVIAVPSEPHFLIDCWHNIKATRPMPVYAVPGLVDHF